MNDDYNRFAVQEDEILRPGEKLMTPSDIDRELLRRVRLHTIAYKHDDIDIEEWTRRFEELLGLTDK